MLQTPIHLPDYLLVDSPLLTLGRSLLANFEELTSLGFPTHSNPLVTPLTIAMAVGYGATFITMLVQIGKGLFFKSCILLVGDVC